MTILSATKEITKNMSNTSTKILLGGISTNYILNKKAEPKLCFSIYLRRNAL